MLFTLLSLIGLSYAAPTPDAAARGERLAGLAGCEACHTAPEGTPYAGGYAIDTSFGTFYGSNLTPDPVNGLGQWTEQDFGEALRHGTGPDGLRYWPAFPFDSFTHLSDDDVGDLWAYLQNLPPSVTPNKAHAVSRGRWQLRFWRLLAFHPRGALPQRPHRSAEWLRGQYLANAVGHCGGCHTPRGAIGGMRSGKYLQGTDDPPESSPDISELGWSTDEWLDLLDLGMLPDGNFVGKQMSRVVEHGTSKLTPSDRKAIAAYMLDLP
ncbi:MAG: mono/diheme cytochrome c family protein [Kiritimatiellia bacterium]|jgi:mono/diheme cytochrome c family protein